MLVSSSKATPLRDGSTMHRGASNIYLIISEWSLCLLMLKIYSDFGNRTTNELYIWRPFLLITYDYKMCKIDSVHILINENK